MIPGFYFSYYYIFNIDIIFISISNTIIMFYYLRYYESIQEKKIYICIIYIIMVKYILTVYLIITTVDINVIKQYCTLCEFILAYTTLVYRYWNENIILRTVNTIWSNVKKALRHFLLFSNRFRRYNDFRRPQSVQIQ